LKYTTSGAAVANFSVAVSEQWKNAEGEKQEHTEWIKVVVWKKLAEICGEWLKKGMQVYVSGRMRTRSYDDKDTGVKKYFTEIIADSVIFLGKSAGGGRPDPEVPPSTGAKDDDLPF